MNTSRTHEQQDNENNDLIINSLERYFASYFAFEKVLAHMNASRIAKGLKPIVLSEVDPIHFQLAGVYYHATLRSAEDLNAHPDVARQQYLVFESIYGDTQTIDALGNSNLTQSVYQHAKPGNPEQILTAAERRAQTGVVRAGIVKLYSTGGYNGRDRNAPAEALPEPKDICIVSRSAPQFENSYLDIQNYVIGPTDPNYRKERLCSIDPPITVSNTQCFLISNHNKYICHNPQSGYSVRPRPTVAHEDKPADVLILKAGQYKEDLKKHIIAQLSALNHIMARYNKLNKLDPEKRAVFKASLSGLGYFSKINNSDELDIEGCLSPLFMSAYKEAIASSNFEYIDAIEFPIFPGQQSKINAYEKCFGVGETTITQKGGNKIRICHKARSADAFTEAEHAKYVLALDPAGDSIVLVGNEPRYGSVEGMVGNNTTVRVVLNYLHNPQMCSPHNVYAVALNDVTGKPEITAISELSASLQDKAEEFEKVLAKIANIKSCIEKLRGVAVKDPKDAADKIKHILALIDLADGFNNPSPLCRKILLTSLNCVALNETPKPGANKFLPEWDDLGNKYNLCDNIANEIDKLEYEIGEIIKEQRSGGAHSNAASAKATLHALVSILSQLHDDLITAKDGVISNEEMGSKFRAAVTAINTVQVPSHIAQLHDQLKSRLNDLKLIHIDQTKKWYVEQLKLQFNLLEANTLGFLLNNKDIASTLETLNGQSMAEFYSRLGVYARQLAVSYSNAVNAGNVDVVTGLPKGFREYIGVIDRYKHEISGELPRDVDEQISKLFETAFKKRNVAVINQLLSNNLIRLDVTKVIEMLTDLQQNFNVTTTPILASTLCKYFIVQLLKIHDAEKKDKVKQQYEAMLINVYELSNGLISTNITSEIAQHDKTLTEILKDSNIPNDVLGELKAKVKNKPERFCFDAGQICYRIYARTPAMVKIVSERSTYPQKILELGDKINKAYEELLKQPNDAEKTLIEMLKLLMDTFNGIQDETHKSKIGKRAGIIQRMLDTMNELYKKSAGVENLIRQETVKVGFLKNKIVYVFNEKHPLVQEYTQPRVENKG